MRQVVHVTCTQVNVHLDEILDVILKLRECADFNCSSTDDTTKKSLNGIDSHVMEILLEHVTRCTECGQAIKVEEQLRYSVRTACISRIEAPRALRERIVIISHVPLSGR